MPASPGPTQAPIPWLARVTPVAGAVVVAWIGSGLASHSTAATVAVALVSGAVVVVAMRRNNGEPPTRISRPRLALAWWAALATVALLWELYAFLQQPDLTRPSHDHPTLSTLLDPVLAQRPVRFAGWLAWLWLGWLLVSRR